MKTLPLLLLIAAGHAALTSSASAGYHVWRGGAAYTYWSADANWSAGGAPVPGEAGFLELAFGPGALDFSTTSDIDSLQVDKLTFSGATNYLIGIRGDGAIVLKPQASGYSLASICPQVLFYYPLILTSDHRVYSHTGTELLLYNPNSGVGGFTFDGTGTTRLCGPSTNSFTGPTTVLEGIVHLDKETGPAIGGALVIGQLGAAQGGYVYVDRPGQIPDTSPVTVHSDSFLFASDDTETIGPLTMTGGSVYGGNGGAGGTTHLVLGGSVTVPATATEPATLGGSISLGPVSRDFTIAEGKFLSVYASVAAFSSAAGITKKGGGTLVMHGDNVFGGDTDVLGGRVILRNNQPDSTVIIHAAGEVTAFDASLGDVVNTGGLLRVTWLATAADGVRCESLSLSNGSVFRTDIRGSMPGAEYGQIEAHGPVTLAGCALDVVPTYDAGVGATFRIIDNFDAGPVSGTFQNLPEGARFVAGDAVWQITYQGGAGGNDVVLTRKADPARLTTIVRQPNGAMAITGTGDAGRIYRKEASTDLLTWTDLGPVTANGSGRMQFTDAAAPNFPRRFYRCPAQ